MKKHSCTTSFVFQFDFDFKKNVELLHISRDCTPEQIGIMNRDEVEQAIMSVLGLTPVFNRHHFVVGANTSYNVYVSDMVRITLNDLFGKEAQIVELKKRFNLTTTLSIVPYIVKDSDEPNQCLSLDDDIVEFLYKTGTQMDLDYYVI